MHSPLSRRDFPDGFIFGSSSSDYQYEGARKKGGRGKSLWDTFCEEHDIQSGEAINQYDLYKGDVEMMKWMGLDACRISIGWSRVLPYGKKSRGLNVEGLQYYRNLVAELSDKGIETYVTLFHFDYPQTLEDEYGGFRSPNIVDDFRDFADICFMVLGDSVKKWVTLNEPWIFSNYGYGNGRMAPGRGDEINPDFTTREGVASLIPQDRYSYARKSSKTKLNKPIAGDAAVEPYQVAHNLLLAHAAVVELYRDKYQSSQKGQIGITLNSIWYEPYSDCKRDHEARDRALDFILGWFMHPVTYGDYPEMMRTRVKSRLPLFTEKESKRLKGSYDFVGINYYSAMYVANVDEAVANARQTCFTDPGVKFLVEKDGKPIGEPAIPSDESNWLYVYPEGIKGTLVYVQEKYNDPAIYITENGICERNNDHGKGICYFAFEDQKRVDYHRDHLYKVKEAIDEKHVKVYGYFTWSAFDNFEWGSGYNVRFGNIHVDYNNGYKRHPKSSAHFFRKLLREKIILLDNMNDKTLPKNETEIYESSDPTHGSKGYENWLTIMGKNSSTVNGSNSLEFGTLVVDLPKIT